MKTEIKKQDNTMENIKKVIIGIGVVYGIYAFVLVGSIVAAVAYDYLNGGNEAFHWVYRMQTGNLIM